MHVQGSGGSGLSRDLKDERELTLRKELWGGTGEYWGKTSFKY